MVHHIINFDLDSTRWLGLIFTRYCWKTKERCLKTFILSQFLYGKQLIHLYTYITIERYYMNMENIWRNTYKVVQRGYKGKINLDYNSLKKKKAKMCGVITCLSYSYLIVVTNKVLLSWYHQIISYSISLNVGCFMLGALLVLPASGFHVPGWKC